MFCENKKKKFTDNIELIKIWQYYFFFLAKKLGEQCFYHQTCMYNDENSLCVQVSHNAFCQCADGFHSVSYSKPIKRVFCTQGTYFIIILISYHHLSILKIFDLYRYRCYNFEFTYTIGCNNWNSCSCRLNMYGFTFI